MKPRRRRAAALQRGPRGAGIIDVWWIRQGRPMSAQLQVQDGWRKTVLDWRMSVSQGIVGAYPGFFPLAFNSSRRTQWKIPADRMAVEPYMGPNPTGPAHAAGISPHHAVTAVNGQSPNLTGRAFLVWFNQRFNPGDTVTLTFQNGPGQSGEITFTLPPRGH